MDLERFFSGIEEVDETVFEKAQPWIEIAGGAALATFGASRRSKAGAGLAIVGGYLVYRGMRASRSKRRPGPIHVQSSFTVQKPVEDLYRFWRNFENLPRFTRNLKSIKVTGARHSHWEAYAPLGLSISWDTEIIEDRENEFIAWQSLPGAMIPNMGSVEFRPVASTGASEVRFSTSYLLPEGRLGAAFGRMFGRDPVSLVEADLQRFERLMMMDEIPAVDGLTSGRRTPWVRMVEAVNADQPKDIKDGS